MSALNWCYSCGRYHVGACKKPKLPQPPDPTPASLRADERIAVDHNRLLDKGCPKCNPALRLVRPQCPDCYHCLAHSSVICPTCATLRLQKPGAR